MDITDTSKRRRDIAIELFCELKEAVSYQGISFQICKSKSQEMLHIRSYSDWPTENTTPEMAKKKIEYSKTVLEQLTEQYSRFDDRIKGIPHKFEFLCDYGTAAVLMAQEENGVLRWLS